MIPRFEKAVMINASPPTVWNALTNVDLMKQWMGENELNLEIITSWKVNSPVIIKGFHHLPFENRGTVLQHQPNKLLQYTHLSSLSRLEDKTANYSFIKFELKPVHNQTELRLTIENFATESIYKHLSFYWRTTIEKIKMFSEQQAELVK